MKYNKQLRWLLFLLIPFILMLVVHILIPLEFISNSHQLQNQKYKLERLNLYQNTVQSLSIINSNSLLSILNKYFIPIRLLNNDSDTQGLFFSVSSTVSLNSAYQFMQSIINNSIPGNQSFSQSMWFAPNCYNSSQFSSNQKIAYESYLRKELFLRSLFEDDSVSAISSISTLYMVSNESIVFQYPTQKNSNYQDLTSSIYGTLFPDIAEQLQSGNLTIAERASIIWDADLNQSFLVICYGSNQNATIQITCEQLNRTKLQSQINSLLIINIGLQSMSEAYLLLNINTSSSSTELGPQIVSQFDNINRISISPNSSFLNLTNFGLSSDVFAIKPYSFRDLYTSRYNGLTNYRVSIPMDSQSPTIYFSFLTASRFWQMGIQSVNIQQSTNMLVIPVVILIFIGSVISAVVIKYLLDSIEDELLELDHRCQFIIEGDLSIEIPDYEGTQDIKQIYQQVKIINRLHRYTVSEYFSGHFAEKVLKYNQCLHFLSNLAYDTGNILQDLGESLIYIQQWQKSIDFLKNSVEMALSQLKERFDMTLNEAVQMKAQRKTLPSGYKEFEVIMMRRLFKLTFSYIKYVELRQIAAKTVSKADQQAFKNKLEYHAQEWAHYLNLLKKVFFPELGGYSQSIMTLIYESKQYANLKRFDQSLKLFEGAAKYLKVYTQQYHEVTKKLKEKGSKFKLLHQKNKLTAHSRVHPDILKQMLYLYLNKVRLTHFTDPEKYNEAIKLYAQGVEGSICTLSIFYLFTVDIRKFLVDLGIDPTHFETTQIFKQGIPFKTLHYGEITKEIEPQLLKFPTKTSPGLQREFVFLVDCAKNRDSNTQKLTDFYSERANHIFNKLIKKTDRLSIIKFNLKDGIRIECKLTLKESNEVILKKQIDQCFRESNQARGNFQDMIQAFCSSINRIKHLQSQKIIIMYFKSLSHYTQLSERLNRKKKRTNESLKTNNKIQQNDTFQLDDLKVNQFGQHVVNSMKINELRNCKVIFYCAMNDSISDFRNFFGLQQVNRRIWGKYNNKNNVVYIIEDKHKADIDRILMLKAQQPADNHVFIL